MNLNFIQYFLMIIIMVALGYCLGYYYKSKKVLEEKFLESLDNKTFRKINEYKNLHNIAVIKIGDKNGKK